MQKTLKLGITLGIASLSAALFAQATVTVYSQNPAPGDLFTNSGTTNQGYDFTRPNWRYNNTRGSGQVGIRNNYPRNGNGSVYFRTPNGNAKSDIEFFGAPIQNTFGNFIPDPSTPNSILGTLNQLTHLSYDWYRDSASTVHSWYHPVIRIGLINPNNFAQVGYLVFERAYNQGTIPVSTDQWISEDIIYSDYKVWNTWGTPDYNKTISQWKSDQNVGSWWVVSINAGVGSGWFGSDPNNSVFIGAVDTIRFGFNGQYTTYNFEVVPEPASLIALGSGVMSLLALRRRRRA